ncbi:unnamed protein product [Effrenium voratum]|nr:unnamed protein product [Effrenium voratum]
MSLSQEEFLRLQQEMIYLKMKTQELKEENARLARHSAEPQLGEALRKAGAGLGAGAVSAAAAIGQRAASLTHSLADGASGFHVHVPFADRADSHEAHSEVPALQERLKEATQELAAARQDAMQAQREAASAEEPDAKRQHRAASPEQDVLSVSQALLLKVQKQQRDLERMREAVDRQQAQVTRLIDKAESTTKPKKTLPALEEQLRGTENKLEDLGRRLQDSQGSSRLTYELRCHLESVLTRVRQRDNAIEQLLNRQERMEHAGVLQRERLAFAQEDLLSHWERKGDGKGGSTADPEPGPSEGPQEAESDVDTHAVGVQVSNEDTAELMWEAAVAVSPSACQSVGDAASLEQELQDLREEIKATKLRSAQRAEDLRAKIRQQQRRAEAEEEAGPSEADVGWLYVQKIEELEQQNRGLEEDLELLQASEQCLQADSREKEEIISSLMRAMRSDDSDRSESESAASYRRPGAGAMFFGLLRRDRSQEKEQQQELEHVAEEALLDNMRLRKDLRTLALEFGKVRNGSPSAEASEKTRARALWAGPGRC